VIRASLASLLVAATLALLPAVALAQDAGGHQYTDPLAGPPPSHSTHGSTGSSGSSGSSTGSSSGSSSSSTTTAQTTASASSGTTASAPSSGLPRTGFPVGFLSFAGAILVSAGLGLRRVLLGSRA